MSGDLLSGGGWFARPILTQKRIVAAFAIAVAADAAQVAFVAVPLADQVIDVVAMALTCMVIGFHPLLLPTFILELVPVADMLPTWTACVAAVVFFRKRAQSSPPAIKPAVTSEPPAESKPSRLLVETADPKD